MPEEERPSTTRTRGLVEVRSSVFRFLCHVAQTQIEELLERVKEGDPQATKALQESFEATGGYGIHAAIKAARELLAVSQEPCRFVEVGGYKPVQVDKAVMDRFDPEPPGDDPEPMF